MAEVSILSRDQLQQGVWAMHAAQAKTHTGPTPHAHAAFGVKVLQVVPRKSPFDSSHRNVTKVCSDKQFIWPKPNNFKTSKVLKKKSNKPQVFLCYHGETATNPVHQVTAATFLDVVNKQKSSSILSNPQLSSR